MNHKYLKKLNFTKDDWYCVPNAKLGKGKAKKKWEKQRKKYGFDLRETYAMDFTLACWIYEHFKWYVDEAPIDLTFHKFDIKIIDFIEGIDSEPRYKDVRVTQKEAINYVFEYFEYYFSHEWEDEYYYYITAMEIVAKIMPAMWW